MQLNGAAARLGLPGDLVILIAYGTFEDAELADYQPRVVFVDEHNHIVRPALRAER
jgi:aspartate 1-decarboxylase